MHIFLVILKIIGITVLILLGIVVTLLMLILLVPVRYSVRAEFDNDASLCVRITWFAGILRLRIIYPKGELWVLRLFGIPLMRSGRKERNKERRRKKKEIAEEDAEDYCPPADNRIAGKPEPETYPDVDNPGAGDEERGVYGKNKAAKHKGKYKNKYKHKNKYKYKNKHKQHRNRKQNKRKTSLKSLFGIIRDERNKRIISFLKSILIKFFKRVRPKKIRADMVIGFEDPAHTGLFFGGLGILTVFWKGKYNITPDFGNKILKGTVKAKGSVRFLDMLFLLIKIIFNEDIRRAIRKGKVN